MMQDLMIFWEFSTNGIAKHWSFVIMPIKINTSLCVIIMEEVDVSCLFTSCVKERISLPRSTFFFISPCIIMITETHEDASQNRWFCMIIFFFCGSFPEAAKVLSFLALFEKWCNSKQSTTHHIQLNTSVLCSS